MNRMEEALRRARRDLKLPESFATPDSAALDQFQRAEPSEAPPNATEADVATAVSRGSEPWSFEAGPEPAVATPVRRAEAARRGRRTAPDATGTSGLSW